MNDRRTAWILRMLVLGVLAMPFSGVAADKKVKLSIELPKALFIGTPKTINGGDREVDLFFVNYLESSPTRKAKADG